MSDQAQVEYRNRLGVSIDCIKFLLRQGLPFCGHDETDDSKNQFNFLKFCDGYVTTTRILKLDMSDKLFSIFIDESKDIFSKEQMSVVLRYVDKSHVIDERFVGIIHVANTNSLSLKETIDEFFPQHGLSIASLRGQEYDGATNMQGEFNGLKALILKENECTFYLHYVSPKLQLALIATAKNHVELLVDFIVTNLVNVIGASAKRRDILRENHSMTIFEALDSGELSTGRGLNQETMIKRPGDTWWGSHYGALLSITRSYSDSVAANGQPAVPPPVVL
ncbi:zinc finger MYM-type protein 1-like [Momordica charantia]|uniref:Zinc finger MYM-type protein 1-like n=1 Tax=Momordica charantia TaxID=3673 RepID=A0A6J1DCH0_MOMCH|nr:zinc finger MYM-type protein 1-like [Momordica charantia]